MKQFSEDIQKLIEEKFPGLNLDDLTVDELKELRDKVKVLREEYFLLEMARKVCSNACYGSAGAPSFYFYKTTLAADITGECRFLTKFMWNRLEQFFHEDIWERKDLWKEFNFALDESKHDWYRKQPISVYSDTDSCTNCLLPIQYGSLDFENLFKICKENNGVIDVTKSGQEIVPGTCHSILNYKDGKLEYVPIKYVMRHKVTKPLFKIRTKSGKEITVTNDHSCIVFRDGKQLTVKAKDINKETDEILSICRKD